jgi:hypothetical protein
MNGINGDVHPHAANDETAPMPDRPRLSCPTMDEIPPPLRKDGRIEDRKHLKYLSTAHYVFAGFLAVGIGFLFVHYWIFFHLLAYPGIFADGCAKAPPLGFFAIFRCFYLAAGGVLFLGIVANVTAGRCITLRKWRTFTLIVDIVNFFQIPFGTALAICTFIVLVRDSVIELYHPGLGGAS